MDKRFGVRVRLSDITESDGMLYHRLAAKVLDMYDQVIVDACVEAAKEAGITDLYLIDKTFLLEAIRDKLDHNTVNVADLMKKQKLIYDEFERAHMVVEVSDIVDLIEGR